MPIYEYTCGKCGQITDALQRVNDPPPERCSHCGDKGTLTKVVSRSSFVLRGGGWYADLYSSKKPDTTSAPKDGKSDAKTTSEPSGAKPDKAAESSASKGDASGTSSVKPKAEKLESKKAS